MRERGWPASVEYVTVIENLTSLWGFVSMGFGCQNRSFVPRKGCIDTHISQVQAMEAIVILKPLSACQLTK